MSELKRVVRPRGYACPKASLDVDVSSQVTISQDDRHTVCGPCSQHGRLWITARLVVHIVELTTQRAARNTNIHDRIER
jgi:hypothetical protein